MLLLIPNLSNIISNMCYNVLVATLSLPQDKILFPLDCRLLRKKCIFLELTLSDDEDLHIFEYINHGSQDKAIRTMCCLTNAQAVQVHLYSLDCCLQCS